MYTKHENDIKDGINDNHSSVVKDKKVYVKPTLIEHDSIVESTFNNTGPGSNYDGSSYS